MSPLSFIPMALRETSLKTLNLKSKEDVWSNKSMTKNMNKNKSVTIDLQTYREIICLIVT